MGINVFADLHHDDLYYSFHLLFEKRLGGNLFRPIGYEWYERGIWRYSSNPDVVNQYLHMEGMLSGNMYQVYEEKHNYYQKALTFEQFMAMPIDLIIASVIQHEYTFHSLLKYKPKAKFIRQAGNVFDRVNFDICKNIMAAQSPKSFQVPNEVNIVYYHPEFDINLFRPAEPKTYNRITNLMNCYPDSADYYLWPIFKSLLPNYEWKMYGILGEDGVLGKIEDIAQAYKDTTFLWHLKRQGDGYGFVLHHSYACGRPPIVIKKYYENRLAEDLMIDGKTCICLDDKTYEEVCEQITTLSIPEKYDIISKNTYERFKEVVNFEKEFDKIKKFLERLK